MTQQERDAAVRKLRDKLAEANQDRVAAMTELREFVDTCRAVGDTIDFLLRDEAMQMNPPVLTSEFPTNARVTYLLSELRSAKERIVQCRQSLTEAGYPSA